MLYSAARSPLLPIVVCQVSAPRFEAHANFAKACVSTGYSLMSQGIFVRSFICVVLHTRRGGTRLDSQKHDSQNMAAPKSHMQCCKVPLNTLVFAQFPAVTADGSRNSSGSLALDNGMPPETMAPMQHTSTHCN
jgi:hypothetical protein